MLISKGLSGTVAVPAGKRVVVNPFEGKTIIVYVRGVSTGAVYVNGTTPIVQMVYGPYTEDVQADIRAVNSITDVSVVAADPQNFSSVRTGIRNSHKIRPMLEAIAKGGTDRIHLGLYGMSIAWGVGSPDTVTGPTAADLRIFRQKSFAANVCRQLNAAVGGTPGYGVDVITNGDALGPWITVAGGLNISTAFNRMGPNGYVFQMQQSTPAYTFSFTETTGSTVKLYGDASGAGVVARVSINGGADVDVTGVASATSTGYNTTVWYEFTVTGLTPGTNTLTFKTPVAASSFYAVWGIDLDHKSDTTPGITLHRLTNSGKALGTLISCSLDDTDTQPAGTWIGSGNATRRLEQTSSISSRMNLSGAFCWFDCNDIKTFANSTMPYGWTLADHKRHIRNFARDMANRNIPVLFLTGPLRDPSTIAGDSIPYTQQDIIDAYQEVSDISTNCAILDFTKQAGEGTLAQRFLTQNAANQTVDGLHWNTAGHAYNARYAVDSIWRVIGANMA